MECEHSACLSADNLHDNTTESFRSSRRGSNGPAGEISMPEPQPASQPPPRTLHVLDHALRRTHPFAFDLTTTDVDGLAFTVHAALGAESVFVALPEQSGEDRRTSRADEQGQQRLGGTNLRSRCGDRQWKSRPQSRAIHDSQRTLSHDFSRDQAAPSQAAIFLISVVSPQENVCSRCSPFSGVAAAGCPI